MPIPADDDDIVLGAELAYLRTFESPIGIRVVVFLVFPIRTDDRRGRKEYLEGGRRILDPFHEPFLLLGSPNAFPCLIWHTIGASIIAPLNDPKLKILAPTPRAISGISDRHLFFENAKTIIPSQVAHTLPRNTVVRERVVIILDKETIYASVELNYI